MLECTIGGITCKCSLLFPAVFLCLLSFGDGGVMLYCYCAAFLHECAHGVALSLCGLKPQTVLLSAFGMRLELPPAHTVTTAQWVFVAAAGPLTNVCCAVYLQNTGATEAFVAAHAVLAVLNSLPVMPLDGGQIAVEICRRMCDLVTAERVEVFVFWTTWLLLIVLGVAVCLYSGGNFTLLVVSLYIGGLRLFYKCD